MNVSLPPELKRWVDEQVKAGSYGTASEYVRDLLRRARDRQVRRAVDASLVEAVEAGATIEADDADWAALRRTARATPASTSRSPSSLAKPAKRS